MIVMEGVRPWFNLEERDETMVEYVKKEGNREFQRDRKPGADYYLGFAEKRSDGKPETDAPYKLEPKASEIEDFLTRLRQQGL